MSLLLKMKAKGDPPWWVMYKPIEGIGAEVHKLDQFFRVEEGSSEVVLDGVHTPIRAGSAIVVPAGTRHDIVNTSSAPLKLYTIYGALRPKSQV